MTRTLLALALSASALAQSPPASYTIAGAVLNSVTLQPIPNARLGLISESSPALAFSTVSGSAGEFSFPPVPAGHYQLGAQHPGFRTQSYGQRVLIDSPGSAVVAGPGLDTAHLRFLLIPPAAISGRITDDHGDVVPNATVHLFRVSVASGIRKILAAGDTMTDDRGQYRFPWLAAGAYFLAATGRPWYTAALSTGPLHSAAYPLTFYPGVTDPSAATAVDVAPGDDVPANLTLPTTTGATLTVRRPAGESGGAHVTLLQPGIGGAGTEVANSFTSGDWTLLPNIAPGRYELDLESASRRASTSVEVSSTDAEVSLAPTPLPTLSGAVALDGPANGEVLILTDEDSGLTTPIPLAPNGAFSRPSIPNRRYRFSLAGRRSLYVRSDSASGAPLVNGLLDLRSASQVRLTLTAAPANARLRGFVYQAGKPLPAAFVLLAPTTPSTDPGDYSSFQTESDGSFDFTNLPPGNYLVFALADGSNLEYANPSVIRPFLAKATPVTLAPNQPRDIKIEVLPRP